MKYPKESFTYGCELELADINMYNKLPMGCGWDRKDITMVNSSGIANDPTGKLWKYGGEITTRPTKTASSQINLISRINKMLNPKPFINYRSNLHIHIGVPGLSKDIEALKKLLKYIHKFEKEAFKITEPIPKPIKTDFKSKEAYDGASKRYRRRLVSHQYSLSEKTVQRILMAKTVEEFIDNHAILGKKGNRLWFITPRAGINLRQISKKETQTIEFRHFPGTLNEDKMYSCLLWCREFMDAALNSNILPLEIKHKNSFVFPKFKKYNHEIDLLWRLTNLSHNTRKEVKKNIEMILEKDMLLDIKLSQKNSSAIESGYKNLDGGVLKWL